MSVGVESLVGRTLRYAVLRRGRGSRRPDPSSDIRIVAPGKRSGDWLGVLVHPRDGFEPDYRWLVTWEQIEDGRYVVVG